MADDVTSDLDERSLFLIQVRYLEEKLERYQLKCDELVQRNTELTCHYKALEKDKKKITDNLKLAVAAKEKKVDELVKLLESQQQTAEKDREALELQQSQEKQELEEQIEEMSSENTRSAEKIDELKEESVKLMQHLQKLEGVKKRLVSHQEENDAAIHRLKAETELKMARMLEDMHSRMDNLLKAKILDVVELEMAHYRKCMEQLEFLQGDSALLLKENDALQNRNKELCVQRDKIKENFNKIKQTVLLGRREVVQLSENCQQLKVEQNDWKSTHQHKLAELKGFRESLLPVFKERRQKTAEAERLGAEIEKERSKRLRLQGFMQDAAIILRHIVTDPGEPSHLQLKAHRVLQILESAVLSRNSLDLQRLFQKERSRTETADPQLQIIEELCGSIHPFDSAPQLDGAQAAPPPLQSIEPDPAHSEKDDCVENERSAGKETF
ncbi:hypothetical protein Q5P01_015317 [Channa striata]|uniref:Cilia- and flagella-associated protein 157 n=1 Tax=Channa striata TaxID=64152 RepID=A0AA88MH47_CHASR|nr:hypothetical protein Q5P01_015317 [Channa striata]